MDWQHQIKALNFGKTHTATALIPYDGVKRSYELYRIEFDCVVLTRSLALTGGSNEQHC